MSTYRELVYLCLDALKLSSDDAYYNEDHVFFVVSKFRSHLLKTQYKDIKKDIPEANYQTIHLDLIEVPAIIGEQCEGGTFLRSKQKIPSLMSIATPVIHPKNYYQGTISFISKERMKYVGYNKWLPNIIYASLGPDNYIYFKSSNPQYLFLKEVNLTGVFEDAEKVAELNGDLEGCDPMDADFPIEENLIPTLIELAVKFLSSGVYKPEDGNNNASDDLSNIATSLRQNLKSAMQKQIEG